MDYYAATLREPGIQLNNDGLMVKGMHFKDRPDLIVMILCSAKADGKTCDRIIRIAEKTVYKQYGKDMVTSLKKIYKKFGKRGLLIKKKLPDITIFVMKGIEYYVMNRGNSRIISVNRLGISELSYENMGQEPYGCEFSKGRLSEGSTLILANDAFFKRQLMPEIHKKLCPQMCMDEAEMQNNIEDLRKQLWSRGETRPVTAVALCVK